MPDPVPATSIIEKLPILELAKVGFLGLACLIFVLAAIVLTTYLVRRNASDAANNLIKTFLSFGTVAIVIAAISQFATLFVNPHSSYQVSMQFSPDMQTNGLPYPRVVMHAKPIKLDEPFALDRDDTIQVIVDEVIKKARELKDQADAANQKAQAAQSDFNKAVAAFAQQQDVMASQVHEPAVSQARH